MEDTHDCLRINPLAQMDEAKQLWDRRGHLRAPISSQMLISTRRLSDYLDSPLPSSINDHHALPTRSRHG